MRGVLTPKGIRTSSDGQIAENREPLGRSLLYHILTELSILCTEVASLPLTNRSEPKESILVMAHPFKYQSTSTKVCPILVRKWDCLVAGFEGQ